MTQMNTAVESTANGGGRQIGQTALAAMAQRYQVSQDGLVEVIKKTCIQGEATEAQFKAFVIVANQYGLNPLTREIHAFSDPRRGVVPIVGIDGWARIVNRQEEFDGCDFEFSTEGEEIACTCTMYVKCRSHPIRVTEYLSECRRNTPPWNTMKRRMLRHKAFIQGARLAFSLSGIYDEDEARDIIQNETQALGHKPAATRAQAVLAKVTSRPVSENQTFEPDPVAVQEEPTHAPQAETTSPAVQPGNAPEARTAEPAKVDKPGGEGAEDPEIDVSGIDTEPPQEERQPPTVPAHEPLLSHEKLMTVMEAFALNNGASVPDVHSFMNQYQAKVGFKSWPKLAPKEREACLAGFADYLNGKSDRPA